MIFHSSVTSALSKAYVCALNPTALRKAKIVYKFGLSECNRVKGKECTKTMHLLQMFIMRRQSTMFSEWIMSPTGRQTIV